MSCLQTPPQSKQTRSTTFENPKDWSFMKTSNLAIGHLYRHIPAAWLCTLQRNKCQSGTRRVVGRQRFGDRRTTFIGPAGVVCGRRGESVPQSTQRRPGIGYTSYLVFPHENTIRTKEIIHPDFLSEAVRFCHCGLGEKKVLELPIWRSTCFIYFAGERSGWLAARAPGPQTYESISEETEVGEAALLDSSRMMQSLLTTLHATQNRILTRIALVRSAHACSLCPG